MRIKSAHGELTIDINTGVILIKDFFEENDPDNYLVNIKLFDVKEFKNFYGEFPDEINILQIGDWDIQGVYTPAHENYRV